MAGSDNNVNNKSGVKLSYSTGGVGHTEETLSKVVKASYESLAPLINMQKRLEKIKKEIADEKSKNRQ